MVGVRSRFKSIEKVLLTLSTHPPHTYTHKPHMPPPPPHTHHSHTTHATTPTHSRNDAKTVNVVSTACFSPVSRIVSTALKFFLSGDEQVENEGAESSGSEVSEGAVLEDGKDARVVKLIEETNFLYYYVAVNTVFVLP